MYIDYIVKIINEVQNHGTLLAFRSLLTHAHTRIYMHTHAYTCTHVRIHAHTHSHIVFIKHFKKTLKHLLFNTFSIYIQICI